jgi:hypothetical protein
VLVQWDWWSKEMTQVQRLLLVFSSFPSDAAVLLLRCCLLLFFAIVLSSFVWLLFVVV